LTHPLNCLFSALAHYVGGSKLTREFDPVGTTTENEHLFSAETLRSDHAAQTNRAPSATTFPWVTRTTAERLEHA